MTADDFRLTLFTLGVSAAAIVVSLPIGLALGWWLARKQWPGKALIETLVMLPLVVPPVVTGLVLLKLFGKKGPFGALLDQWGIEIIFTWKAVVLALAIMAFPLLLRCIRTAFEEVPRHLEEAAATLGKTPWQVFSRVSVPLAIYRSFHAGNDERVWMLAGVSAAIAFLALWVAGRLTKGRSL